MKTWPRLLGCWSVIALTIFAGCVPSLNPVFNDTDLIFDRALVGVWWRNQSRWELTQRDEKSYRMMFTDGFNIQRTFIGRLARLEGEMFLDLYPEFPQMDSFYGFHLVPIHTIWRVRRTQPTFELAQIDLKWLDEYLARHPSEIEHVPFTLLTSGRFKLITAPTPAVQKFVLAHKDKFTDYGLSFQRQRIN